MKRRITTLLLLAMATSVLAQTTSTSQSNAPERVTATLRAASAKEPSPSREQQTPADKVTPRQASRESKRMPCERLRAEIDRKIRANGVPRYSLEVAPTAQVKNLLAENPDRRATGKIVGSCGGGNYKILYRRG